MELSRLRILLVDDDEDDYIIARDLLSDIEVWNIVVDWAASYDDALEAIACDQHDVYFIDYCIGKRTGVELLREAVENGCTAPIIFLTGQDNHKLDIEAMKAGAADYLVKGKIDTAMLERSVRYALKRKQTEALLEQKSRELFKVNKRLSEMALFAEFNPHPVLRFDHRGTLLSVNRASVDIFGKEAVDGKPLESVLPSMKGIDLGLVIREGLIKIHEAKVKNHYFQFVIRGIPDSGYGHLYGSDISTRKRAEEELRASEDKFRAILESSPDAIVVVNRDGRIMLVNNQTEKMFGYNRNTLLGETVETLLPKRFRKGHGGHRKKYYANPQTRLMARDLDLYGRRRDGSEFSIEISLSPIKTESEELIISVIHDITERKHAAEELFEAHMETEQLLTSISSILIGISPDDRITRWNAAAEQTFGIEGARVLGKSFLNCAIKWNWQEVYVRIAECREKDRPTYLHDIQFTRVDGSEGFLDLTVNPIANDSVGTSGYLLLATEVTERKLLESQLSQAQKLESIGQLAAGIAHEINTPIQYVGDNTRFLSTAFGTLKSVLDKNQQLLKAAKEDSLTIQIISEAEAALKENKVEYMIEEIPMAIEETLSGVERVATIVRAMKEFSHPGAEEKTLTDINKALENTITVARNEWKYVAEIVKDFEASLPFIPCLPGEVNQVFLNIIVNAAHAIADVAQDGSEGKGVIKVSTSSAPEWVEVKISDSGTGIPEKARAKIFDPFFTTKEIGKGTGQGLAIAHNVVVKKHGGSINFETDTGKGTTFKIRLPINA